MTRIISGFAGSRTIRVPRGGTRPTSDRVREAAFSALAARDALAGATVLDLYAGSGALGLEAASRGAAAVTLVEREAAAARLCRSNAAIVLANAPAASTPSIIVQKQSVMAFLTSASASFDVVFIDPPYALSDPELAQNLQLLAPRLTPNAIVVVERSTRSAAPTWPTGLVPDRRARYGETTLWWAEASEVPSQPRYGSQPDSVS
ncbi:MAG: 16S rRNA (guanine(966)-N(2))-methyltransferase RsmD [Microbacteriaceae bacterium]